MWIAIDIYVASFPNLHRHGWFGKYLSHTTYDVTSINTKSKRKSSGATMCTKVKKAHENDVHSLVNFDLRTEKNLWWICWWF